jgi:hypothetical protein
MERSHGLPPGIGAVKLEGERLGPEDHFRGFSAALDNALKNIGRAPGRYRVEVELSATVVVENPGIVIEYIATII